MRIEHSSNEDGVQHGRVEKKRSHLHRARQNPQEPTENQNPKPEEFDYRPSSPIPGVIIPNLNNASARLYREKYNINEDRWYEYRTRQQTKNDNLTEIAMRTLMLIRQQRHLQQQIAMLKQSMKTIPSNARIIRVPVAGVSWRNGIPYYVVQLPRSLVLNEVE